MEEQASAERELQLLKEQELSNLLHRKDYVRAVGVAISLDQPYRVRTILQGTARCAVLRLWPLEANACMFTLPQSCWTRGDQVETLPRSCVAYERINFVSLVGVSSMCSPRKIIQASCAKPFLVSHAHFLFSQFTPGDGPILFLATPTSIWQKNPTESSSSNLSANFITLRDPI